MNPLLAAVQAEPDDDRVRMVYADFLQQQGDIQGEFIAVQVQLAQARAAHDHKLATKLAKRERQILEDCELQWVAELRAGLRRATKFRRGFVEVALLEDARELLPHVAMLRRVAPLLRAIEVHGPIGAIGHWDLAHVDEVVAHKPIHHDDLKTIASAETSRLKSLSLLGNGMGDAALVAVTELPQPLVRLELGIDGRPTRRLDLLPRLAKREGLRELTIRMPASFEDLEVLGALKLDALGVVGGDPSARSFARLIAAMPLLQRLELRESIGWKLDLGALRGLTRLRVLRLNQMQITDEQLEQLAPELANLVELDVRSNGLTGPGLVAVCQHATALRRLLIGGNPIDPATKAQLKAMSKQLHVVLK